MHHLACLKKIWEYYNVLDFFIGMEILPLYSQCFPALGCRHMMLHEDLSTTVFIYLLSVTVFSLSWKSNRNITCSSMSNLCHDLLIIFFNEMQFLVYSSFYCKINGNELFLFKIIIGYRIANHGWYFIWIESWESWESSRRPGV